MGYMSYRICLKCNITKRIWEFQISPYSRKRDTWCKPCGIANRAASRKRGQTKATFLRSK